MNLPSRNPHFAGLAFMNRLTLVFCICSFIACGQDAVHRSTLTVSGGGLPYADGAFAPQHGGPVFGGNYEYRFFRYLAAEVGTDISLPAGVSFGESSVIPPGQNLSGSTAASSAPTGCASVIPPGQNFITVASSGTAGCALVSGRSRVTLATFGFKGILPLAASRVELFAGLGGAYGWNSVGGRFDSVYGQGSAGARFAVDRHQRFWVGTTLRGFTNFTRPQQAWLPWTVDLGFRFGQK